MGRRDSTQKAAAPTRSPLFLRQRGKTESVEKKLSSRRSTPQRQGFSKAAMPGLEFLLQGLRTRETQTLDPVKATLLQHSVPSENANIQGASRATGCLDSAAACECVPED